MNKKEQIEKCITNIKSNMEKIMKLADLDYINCAKTTNFRFTATKNKEETEDIFMSCCFDYEDNVWGYGENYNKLFENIKEN